MNPEPVYLPLADALPWWLDVLTMAPILIMALITYWFWRQSYSGLSFVMKQSDFLDHQKDASTKTLEQNKVFEEMTARQYQENNDRADRALAQSEEALRLHAASLEQLSSMNKALLQLTETLQSRDRQQPAS